MHLENSIITGIKIAWNQWLWYNWVVKKQLQTGGSCNTPDFAKDTVYRFMKMVQINWMRFTTILASRIINNAILPLDSEDRANVLIIDDSKFERNRSKKVELHAKVYDHTKHKYRFGFRMLTLGWSDGSTFLPVNSILLSTENKKRRGKSTIFSCFISLWEFDHQHTECGILTTL